MSRRKRKSTRFGRRTDTRIVGVTRDTRDGTTYFERKDGSEMPKETTIAVTETLKRLLNMFKNFGGYPSYNDVILKLILDLLIILSMIRYR